MKILEVATSAPPYKGGVSRIVNILSDGLRQRGHQVLVLTPQVRFKELSFSSIPFRQYCSYDVIHLHGPTPFLSDLMFLTNHNIPIVYTHHCEPSWISEKISKIYRTFHRFLSRKARVIIVHSNDYAYLFKGNNVKVIQMPCKFKPISLDFPQKSNVFTVLFVGQFRPYKGIDILLKAAYLLRNIDINFVLVGEGYLKPKFQLLVRSLNLKNVKILSNISDEELIKLYKFAHIICLPSINTCEAYGLSLIEGALYGCLPLASNLPGVRENILNLRGLLFEAKCYISLAKKIKFLFEERELWAELARRSQRAAYNYVTTYTPEYYVKEHEMIFRDILSGTNHLKKMYK